MGVYIMVEHIAEKSHGDSIIVDFLEYFFLKVFHRNQLQVTSIEVKMVEMF